MKITNKTLALGWVLALAGMMAIIFTAPAKAEPYAGFSIATGFGETGAQSDYIKEDGVIAGAFIGHNYKYKKLMLGIEGDINWSGVTGDLKADGARVTASSNYTGSVRGRAGAYFTDDLLVYTTAGLALENKSIDAKFDGGRLSKKRLNYGWTAGVGAEYKVTNTIGVRGEVRHTRYQTFDFFGENLDSSATTVGAGVIFKLN